jgi:hypothetical protein
VILSDKLYIPFSEVEDCFKSICDLFTYQNPEYYKKLRLGYSVKAYRGRPATPATLYNYTWGEVDGVRHLVLPRGGLHKIRDFYEKTGKELVIDDRRVKTPETGMEFYQENFTLGRHQVSAINVLSKNGGLIEIGCGGGKTVLSLVALAKIRQKTLIIVHTEALQKQWIQELKKYSRGIEIGRFDGKAKKDGDVVVALVQSLVSRCVLADGSTDFGFLQQFGAWLLTNATTHQQIPLSLLSITHRRITV